MQDIKIYYLLCFLINKFKTKKMIKIINTWYKPMQGNEYYYVSEPIYQKGDYKIFEQSKECYLHTYKNVAITQLVKPNINLINNLFEKIKPVGKYSPFHFIYERALENKKKGLKIEKLKTSI